MDNDSLNWSKMAKITPTRSSSPPAINNVPAVCGKPDSSLVGHQPIIGQGACVELRSTLLSIGWPFGIIQSGRKGLSRSKYNRWEASKGLLFFVAFRSMILSSETRVVMIDLLVDTSMMLLNHCFCPFCLSNFNHSIVFLLV